MIPDPEHVRIVAEGFERELNSHGWDNQAPLLLMLTTLPHMNADDGAMAIGLMEFPLQPIEFSGDFGEGLQLMEKALRGNPDDESLRRWTTAGPQAPQVLGLMTSAEAWGAVTAPDERDGRMLADIPGTKEVRFVMAVDCGGRTYWHQRIRGEQPSTYTFEPGDTDTRIGGQVTYLMVKILKELTKFMAADQVDRAALNQVLRTMRGMGS